MQKRFEKAIEDAKPLWGELAVKLPALAQCAYADADEAMDEMTKFILAVKGTKWFAQRCRQAYQKAGYKVHTAYNVFECVCEAAGDDLNQDAAYSKNAIAGAVLLKLLL
jgi:hypothetical protein